MNASRSIQPRETTCWRILAFCPPPNEVDEIAANARATRQQRRLRRLRRMCRASRHPAIGPLTTGRRVLTRKDVDVHVFGVLIWRQHAHANHEAFFVEIHRDCDLLYAGDQTVPDATRRRDPKSRIVGTHFFGMITTWISHHSGLTPVDVVAKGENVFVFVDDLVGFGARSVETAAKRVLRIGLLPNALLRAADQFGNPLRHCGPPTARHNVVCVVFVDPRGVLPGNPAGRGTTAGGFDASRWRSPRHGRNANTTIPSLRPATFSGGAPEWPKEREGLG